GGGGRGVGEAAGGGCRGAGGSERGGGAVGLPRRPQHRVGAPALGVDAPAARDSRRDPAAVSPRRPVAGNLALEHDDAQIGLEPLQVVRGPEPGEAGADDRDVAARITAERRARLERFRHAVEPEAALAVALFHAARDTHEPWAPTPRIVTTKSR